MPPGLASMLLTLLIGPNILLLLTLGLGLLGLLPDVGLRRLDSDVGLDLDGRHGVGGDDRGPLGPGDPRLLTGLARHRSAHLQVLS